MLHCFRWKGLVFTGTPQQVPQQEASRVMWSQQGANRSLGEPFLHKLKEHSPQAEHFPTHKPSLMRSSKAYPLLAESLTEWADQPQSFSGVWWDSDSIQDKRHSPQLSLPDYLQNEHKLPTWRTTSTCMFIPSVFLKNDTPKCWLHFSQNWH